MCISEQLCGSTKDTKCQNISFVDICLKQLCMLCKMVSAIANVSTDVVCVIVLVNFNKAKLDGAQHNAQEVCLLKVSKSG